jgi:hypothetical protein
MNEPNDKASELSKKIMTLQIELEKEKRSQRSKAITEVKSIITKFNLSETDLFRKPVSKSSARRSE